MTPEVVVGIIAVFVSGGALGAAGTLLGQWVLRKIQVEEPKRSLSEADLDLLRGDFDELTKKVHMIDVRLDFSEQLLGGSSPLAPPPDESLMLPPESIPEDGAGPSEG